MESSCRPQRSLESQKIISQTKTPDRLFLKQKPAPRTSHPLGLLTKMAEFLEVELQVQKEKKTGKLKSCITPEVLPFVAKQCIRSKLFVVGCGFAQFSIQVLCPDHVIRVQVKPRRGRTARRHVTTTRLSGRRQRRECQPRCTTSPRFVCEENQFMLWTLQGI